MVTCMSNKWPAAAEFEFLRQMVFERSRIHLGNVKHETLGRRLESRLRASGLATYQDYCDFLTSADGANELTELIDAISADATRFFDGEHQFEFLANVILPQWAKTHTGPGLNVFRIWTAGCGSGEEAYTLAIVLADFSACHAPFQAEIIATDISRRALQHARKGIYRLDQVQSLDLNLLKRYFLKGVGAYQGSCRVKDSVKKMVSFRQASLFDQSRSFDEPVHVIFCRNVLGYFDRTSQEQLARQFLDKLKPEGYLFLGHSETLPRVPNAFTQVRPGLYRETASLLAYV
jgi:chemotaxis protein methyltransferase CheR